MLQTANAAPVSRARSAIMRSRARPFARWYGDADGLTMSVAPASASAEAGGPAYQTSSQIVRPTRAFPSSISAGVLPGSK